MLGFHPFASVPAQCSVKVTLRKGPRALRPPSARGSAFLLFEKNPFGFLPMWRLFSPGPDLGALARPLLRCWGLFERRKLSSMGVVIVEKGVAAKSMSRSSATA